MGVDLACMRQDLINDEARILTDQRSVQYVAVPTGSAAHPYGQGRVAFTLAAGWAQCGNCGVAWNDAVSTSVTPTPSARCPFEDQHNDIRDLLHDYAVNRCLGTVKYRR